MTTKTYEVVFEDPNGGTLEISLNVYDDLDLDIQLSKVEFNNLRVISIEEIK